LVSDPSAKRAHLSIIGLSCAEQSFERVVSWNEKPGNVHEKFTSDIEEDKEEVNPNEAEESINFRDRCLLLEVVEHRVLRKL